jgi:hypothetical protein
VVRCPRRYHVAHGTSVPIYSGGSAKPIVNAMGLWRPRDDPGQKHDPGGKEPLAACEGLTNPKLA